MVTWRRNSDTYRAVKNFKTIHHRGTEGTEFYFVNCAVGAVNNEKLFSVPSVPSVPLWWDIFDVVFERALMAEISRSVQSVHSQLWLPAEVHARIRNVFCWLVSRLNLHYGNYLVNTWYCFQSKRINCGRNHKYYAYISIVLRLECALLKV